VQQFFDRDLSCVVVTEADKAMTEPPDDVGAVLVAAADEAETPLLTSSLRSSETILALHSLLDERLAPRARVHGVLVDVFEVGLLLFGSSGVGKSEVGLELIMRGHRLVADDVVECHYRPPGMVFGSPADLLRHHLEVRGLGILNIKDLFGVTAVRGRKRVDVVVQLVERDLADEQDRLGLEERYHEILGVQIRELLIQVRPGRDIASILEIAARNELLKQAGHHPAREFFGRLEGALMGNDSEVPAALAGRRPEIPSAPRLANLAPAAPESSVGPFDPRRNK
jgi:HPr kinase/phosphorylase